MEIASIEDARALETEIRAAADAACAVLAQLLAEREPLDVMRAMKFGPIGFQPLAAREPAFVMEQVHQTFAYLTTVRAVMHLFERHPEHAPYQMNLGTASVPDVVSADGQVAAETLAIITPADNNKFRSDVQRIKDHEAALRYVFYYAPDDTSDVVEDGIEVVQIQL